MVYCKQTVSFRMARASSRTLNSFVCLTSSKQSPTHNIIRLHREVELRIDDVHHVAGGPFEGLIIMKYQPDEPRTVVPDVVRAYIAIMTDKSEKEAKKSEQELRELHFIMEESDCCNKETVNNFFEELLDKESPTYVSVLKEAMNMLNSGFLSIKEICFEFKTVEITTIPNEDSAVTNVTMDKLREILENAYPNAISAHKIASHFNCSVELIVMLLEQLQHGKIAHRRGDEWIRLDENKLTASATETTSFLVQKEEPQVAIICLLYVEKVAIDGVMDHKDRGTYYQHSGGETHVYTFGWIGDCRVVSTKLAFVGDHRVQRTSIRSITTRLVGNFPSINSVVLCGVGLALRNATTLLHEIRLGDVVVSSSYVHSRRVVHDEAKEKVIDLQMSMTTSLEMLSDVVKPGDKALQISWEDRANELVRHLGVVSGDFEWRRPPLRADSAVNEGSPLRTPKIWNETIAAAFDLKCFEMTPENALVAKCIFDQKMRDMAVCCLDAGFQPVIDAAVGSCVNSWVVVRGIADYEDSGEGNYNCKIWQAFAALQAAAFMRELVQRLPNK